MKVTKRTELNTRIVGNCIDFNPSFPFIINLLLRCLRSFEFSVKSRDVSSACQEGLLQMPRMQNGEFIKQTLLKEVPSRGDNPGHASRAAPRVSSPSPSPTETPSKKRPIPQPRQRQLSSTSSLLQSTGGGAGHSQRAHPQTSPGAAGLAGFPSKDSSLTKSLRNLLPDLHHHQPVPTPTANFKSFKRVVPPPPPPTTQHAPHAKANPEYVNTAAPSLPQRRKQGWSPKAFQRTTNMLIRLPGSTYLLKVTYSLLHSMS